MESERREIEELIKYEEEVIKSMPVVQDDLIELTFKKGESLQSIESVLKRIKLKYEINVNDRKIFIRRSELDKTAYVFQEKLLQFKTG